MEMEKINQIKNFTPIRYSNSEESKYIDALFDDIDFIIQRYNYNNNYDNYYDEYNNVNVIFNNAILDITLIYTYIIQTIVVRLYLEDTYNVFKFYRHFISKDFFKKSFEKDFKISTDTIKASKIESDLVNFITFYIKNKNDNVDGIVREIKDYNADIFKYRNQIAHTNFQLYKYDIFLQQCNKIIKSLEYLYEQLFYPQNSDKSQLITNLNIYKDLETRIKNNTIDKYDYKSAFEELNKQYLLSIYDYKQISDYIDKIPNNEIKKYLEEYFYTVLGFPKPNTVG